MPRIQTFDLPGVAEVYLREQTAIRKARFVYTDGGTMDLGIFKCIGPEPDHIVGVCLSRDNEGAITGGTVANTPGDGLEWFEGMKKAQLSAGAIDRRLLLALVFGDRMLNADPARQAYQKGTQR